ncbi:hypothetical protein [Abyssogena phaseoliformis symbiont]|uniref:hypothetical protein n=1 Tax=Abyssogena phaseoliformis symbiont TaxID=596095 RepID=UPI00191653CF|nr:hypothetical protein [Abyssogena phaseoliformis symbiont]
MSTKLGYQSASPIAMAETNYRDKRFNIEHLANIAKCLNIGVTDLLTDVDELL